MCQARSKGERAEGERSNKRSGLRRTGTEPRTVQTDATVSIEPIPIDAERLAFDGDAYKPEAPASGIFRTTNPIWAMVSTDSPVA